MKKLVQQLTKVREQLKSKIGREPTIQEIADEVKLPAREVLKALVPQADDGNPATLQFFAIYEKNRPILVLPCLLNIKFMSLEEMNQLTMMEGLSGKIVIPADPLPWSKISPDADHIFLALQSRRFWGASIDQKTNLLKVEAVRELVEQMQESLNNYCWRKDYFAGKFSPGSEQDQNRPPESSKPPVKEDPSEGVLPGSNW